MSDDTRHRETVKGLEPHPDFKDATAPQPKLPDGQHADHWVMPEEERKKGYVRPYRDTYKHLKCGGVTRMPSKCAETYARQPDYYGQTFCCNCGGYFRVGAEGEFVWDGTDEKVGT